MRLALVCLIGLTAVGRAESAEEMLFSCKGLTEARLSDEQVRSAGTFASGKCWKAFAAVQAVIELVLSPDPQPVLRVCPPPKCTRTQLIAIFAEYLRTNPKKLKDDFLRVAGTSLHEAFPCPAPKQASTPR